MRAVVISEPGGPDVLTISEVPDPTPGPDEILIEVRHSAVNRADVLQRMGAYPDPVRRSHNIPGLEYSGVVAALGERVTEWNVGDPVMGIEAGACYAELLTTPSRQALPIPASIESSDASAIPEVFLTAWDALVVQGGLTSGRVALVHAGASGVGTAAIQICRAIGARVAVTASSGKLDACRSLGANAAFPRSPDDWLAECKHTFPGGVDVILDVIGGEEATRNLSALSTGGSVVQVGLMGGANAGVNLGLLLMKRAHWIGTTLRSRPIEQKIALVQQFRAEMLGFFDEGDLKPVIDSRYPMTNVAEAHRHMESNANVGKILLDW